VENEECETEIKDQVAAEIVVLPFDEDSEPESIQEEDEHIEGECAICGKTPNAGLTLRKTTDVIQ